MKKSTPAEPSSPTDPIPAPAPADAAPAPAPEPPAPAALTAAEIADLQRQAAGAAENWDNYLRAKADLENYRKRVARERQELIRSTREETVTALLPVLDNLERAIDAARQHGATDNPLLIGMQQILTQFQRCLQDLQVQEVAAMVGQPFDPNLHEAVSHQDSSDHPDGAVLQQLQRGYRTPERLLRAARVVVSRHPPASS